MAYRCICGKTINVGDKVVWVEKAKNNILVPFCSIECGEKFKQFTIKKLKEKLKAIENQILEEEILDEILEED